jgi:hypothetical protein
MKLTDEQLKEMLVGMPRVREALCTYASIHGKSIDELLDELVARLHNTNIKKTRRKVEEELRHSEVLTYLLAAMTRVVNDPVIR